jgi:hypothetical protein
MLQGNKFICDCCNEAIKTKDIVEVQTVDRNCCSTGEVIKYFHLATDPRAKYYGQGGCYKKWTKSDDSFIPHGVRLVPKQDVLKNLPYATKNKVGYTLSAN